MSKEVYGSGQKRRMKKREKKRAEKIGSQGIYPSEGLARSDCEGWNCQIR